VRIVTKDSHLDDEFLKIIKALMIETTRIKIAIINGLNDFFIFNVIMVIKEIISFILLIYKINVLKTFRNFIFFCSFFYWYVCCFFVWSSLCEFAFSIGTYTFGSFVGNFLRTRV